MTYFDSNEVIRTWRKYHSGDVECETALLSQFSRLVRVCARSYFLSGGETEDLIQEGMLGLLCAMRNFDPGRGILFETYAEYCIRNRMIDAVKASNRKKNLPLNSSVSLEFPDIETSLSFPSEKQRSPEDVLIENERAEEILRNLKSVLSRFETRILECYLEGLSYSEIAALVNKSVKSVDNAVQRIRRKLLQQLKYSENSTS